MSPTVEALVGSLRLTPLSPAGTRKRPKRKPALRETLKQYKAGLSMLAQAMEETGLAIHGVGIDDLAFALAALAKIKANSPWRDCSAHLPSVTDPVRRTAWMRLVARGSYAGCCWPCDRLALVCCGTC